MLLIVTGSIDSVSLYITSFLAILAFLSLICYFCSIIIIQLSSPIALEFVGIEVQAFEGDQSFFIDIPFEYIHPKPKVPLAMYNCEPLQLLQKNFRRRNPSSILQKGEIRPRKS